jgi:hypothetical protein
MITPILLTAAIIEMLLIGVLIYLVFNLDRKITTYEFWLTKYRTRVDEVYDQLKSVDDKNLFEKDDDVGFVFSELVRIMKDFDEEIK